MKELLHRSTCHEYEGGWTPEPGSPKYQPAVRQVRVLVMSECHNHRIEWEPEEGSRAYRREAVNRLQNIRRKEEAQPTAKPKHDPYVKPMRWTASEARKLRAWRKDQNPTQDRGGYRVTSIPLGNK